MYQKISPSPLKKERGMKMKNRKIIIVLYVLCLCLFLSGCTFVNSFKEMHARVVYETKEILKSVDKEPYDSDFTAVPGIVKFDLAGPLIYTDYTGVDFYIEELDAHISNGTYYNDKYIFSESGDQEFTVVYPKGEKSKIHAFYRNDQNVQTVNLSKSPKGHYIHIEPETDILKISQNDSDSHSFSVIVDYGRTKPLIIEFSDCKIKNDGITPVIANYSSEAIIISIKGNVSLRAGKAWNGKTIKEANGIEGLKTVAWMEIKGYYTGIVTPLLYINERKNNDKSIEEAFNSVTDKMIGIEQKFIAGLNELFFSEDGCDGSDAGSMIVSGGAVFIDVPKGSKLTLKGPEGGDGSDGGSSGVYAGKGGNGGSGGKIFECSRVIVYGIENAEITEGAGGKGGSGGKDVMGHMETDPSKNGMNGFKGNISSGSYTFLELKK